MNKLNKIFLVIIIVLLFLLFITSYYFIYYRNAYFGLSNEMVRLVEEKNTIISNEFSQD
ncbi:hypothetical protein [Candidatus Ruminimicrobium bovinum]|uniref:hypothetical protein n=1 Tax=Candidatus Ruminimicrobium bovinum TaxID=3242779 RepID=UPI0039B8514F